MRFMGFLKKIDHRTFVSWSGWITLHGYLGELCEVISRGSFQWEGNHALHFQKSVTNFPLTEMEHLSTHRSVSSPALPKHILLFLGGWTVSVTSHLLRFVTLSGRARVLSDEEPGLVDM